METGVPGDPGDNVLAPVVEGYNSRTVNVIIQCLRMEEDFAWVKESSTNHATQRNVHQTEKASGSSSVRNIMPTTTLTWMGISCSGSPSIQECPPETDASCFAEPVGGVSSKCLKLR